MNMDGNIRIVERECVGCGNCELVCPKSAISMQSNREGFLYPVVDESLCVDCGLCKTKCPQLKSVHKAKFKKQAYIAISKNKKLYQSSASGGVFSSVATEFLNVGNAHVCGAAYLDGQVRHVLIDNAEGIRPLQGSKYVQSYLGSIFVKIREVLNNGEKVLFSGTPCQVAAIKAYVGEDRENLYTMDLICHGVPSPSFLKKDLSLYGKDEIIQNIQFRKKHNLYKSKSYYFLTLKRSSSRTMVIPYNRDPYFNLFMEGKTFRYSCYNCHYANLDRVGDVTIGDCDSSFKYPQFHGYEATSTLIVNTQKGKELLESFGKLLETEYLDIIGESEKNHQLSYASKLPEERNEIYQRIEKLDVGELRDRYTKPYTLKAKVYRFLNVVLPPRIVSHLLEKR